MITQLVLQLNHSNIVDMCRVSERYPRLSYTPCHRKLDRQLTVVTLSNLKSFPEFFTTAKTVKFLTQPITAEAVQQRAYNVTKILYGFCKKFNILSSSTSQVGCFMYRCMNALLPNDFCFRMFIKNADFHSYGTRNRDTVHMTTCRLNLRKHSIEVFVFSAPNYGTVCL